MDANGTHLSKKPIQTNGMNDTDQLNGISNGVNVRFVNGLSHANSVNGHFEDIKPDHAIDVSHSSNPKESFLSNDTEVGTTQGPEPVAIVGMAVRLPGGVQSCNSFWELLINKRDGRCRVPSSRYNVDGFYSTDSRPGAVNSHHGYFLQNGLEHLDASFFSMIKTEVESVDPQQRMLLEVVRECLESAGETAWRGKKIGCYVGVYGEDWLDIGAKDTQSLGLYRITGAGDFVIANRVSYEYDFRGPSMVIRTACSSSLLGLHMACQALYNGECTSAVIGGTNLIIGPTMTIAMTEQGVLSPTGSCKTFDANADGYARGEAINAIYIKKLSDAVRDGDPIRAIVRATAANSDGKTPGIPSPSSEAHEALMRRAYQYAGIDPSQTGFVECHGTGTQTGDPLETGAVARVFGKDGVFIGSVKPNVGHSEGASGLTSVIKTVLALENRIIPPQIHFTKANPKIPFETAQLKIPLEPTPWPEDRRERASVNSFGIGGANAHVILESSASYSIARSPVGEAHFEPRLLLFSANHAESYQSLCASYKNYLQLKPSSLSDLAYTLGRRREHLSYRGFSVLSDSTEIEVSPPAKIKPGLMEMIFVFTGQGAQWAGMGKELFFNNAEFRTDIQYMDQVLASLDPPPCWRIQDELLQGGDTSNLRLAEYAQPMVTAVQIGIVKILRKWNVTPDAVVGHSSGEIAAAFSCGALSMSEAIITAYYRGLITTRQTRTGGMAAIGLGRDDAIEYLVPGLVIACENSPQSVTVSGDIDAVDMLIEKLNKERPDILARKLQVDMAYHSHHMHALGDDYEALINQYVSPERPTTPFYSSVKGKPLVDSGALNASYWRENLESPVLFYTAIKAILDGRKLKSKIFLEVGPHSALAGPLRQIFKSSLSEDLTYVPTLTRGKDCTRSLLTTAGQLFSLGASVDYSAIVPYGDVLTDLPVYPWHHDTEYWSESRLSREWRLRRYPHHDILGSRIAEGSDLEPTWRNTLNLDAVPWVRDHKLHSDMVFPFAGYIAMAGEAVRQLSAEDEDFSLRRVVVKNALVLQESARMEMMTNLRPMRLTDSLNSTWYEFSIASLSNGVWTNHCTGEVRSGSDNAQRSTLPHENLLPRIVSSTRWYKTMRSVGLAYGPAFQGLRDISAHTSDGSAAATVRNESMRHESFYYLHPTAIDVCLQLFSVAGSKGVPRMLHQLSVPVFAEEIYIRSYSNELRLHVKAGSSVKGITVGDALATSAGRITMTMKGLKMSAIEDTDNFRVPDPLAGARFHWKPDIDFLDCKDLIWPSASKVDLALVLERFTVLCMIENSLQLRDLESSIGYFLKYRRWMTGQAKLAEQGKYPLIPDAQRFAALDSLGRISLIMSIAETVKETEAAPLVSALLNVFESLPAMFVGDKDPLAMFFQDDSFSDLYTIFSSLWDHSHFFDHLTHQRPNMRILEIGAGTGGTTALLMKYLKSQYQERMYSNYTFTDISSGFLIKAKERFSFAESMEFSILDISKDPLEQGFQVESYDLIIASNVLHATPNLKQSLQNVRKLVRPDGRLFFQELCPIMQLFNYIMGVFPGWWLGEEDGRLEQPTVSPEKWAEELRSTGFDGLETVVYDHEHPYQVMATMVARPARELCIQKSVTLLHRSTEANLVVQNVKSIFTDAGYFVTLTNLSHEPVVGQDVISLLDLEGPFFDNISAEDFAAFKAFVSKLGSMRILYVTGSCQVWCKDPRYAAVLGLARTLRSELSVSFATCEMDNLTIEPGQDIFRVFCKFQLSEEASNVGPETEFAVSNGKIHIGRMHWLTLGQQYPESTQNKPDTKKRLDIVTPGVLQSLEWQSAETTDLTGEQVEVEMRAVGVNFKDVLIAMGYVPAKAGSLGVEGSGIVRRVSPEVRDLKPGDRVMVLEAGAFTTMLRTRARVCVKMLDDMSFEAAATIPSVFGTVIWSLIDTKHLQKDETVLIHSACGGVGLAAMEICQMIGATVYATVGTEEKAQYLMQRYGLPRNRIFYSRDTSFLPDLMRETNGRGVDAVLNSLSGELLHASWQCVAEFGMMLEIGKRDFLGRGKLNMDLFEQNRSFIGVDCAQICNERPDIVQNMLARSVKWYGQGLIRPIEPMTCFPATKVEECFRYMQKGQHIGKIVITMPKNLEDLHLASINPKISLRPDKAYLLVGGLGGLGKAVSVWLVEHGARHLIYLGRSAGRSDSDKRFIAELALMGCSAQWFQGSVAIMEDVQNAVKKASKPIAGVLQMSMVLRDQAWRQMTHESWQAVHSPKVTGTWNLHNALLDYPLDFFVLFSSYSGIVGQWGQANYASSNTFLNSFTQYRHSLGLPASCLDIGAIEDIGFVSENPIILDQFRATGNPLLGENDLLDVLQLAIVRSPAPSKLIDEGDFCNPNQILQGLKSTLPLSDPNNRTIWKHDPRMSIYRNLETASSAPATSTNEALKHFLSATSQDPALLAQESSLGFLAREIGARLQDLLLRSSEDLDLDANLSGMGVDSLVSIEIKNWWKRNLGLEITVLEILSAGTVRNLASVAVKGLKEKYGGADAVAGGTEKEETGTVNMQTDGERKEEFMHMKAA